MNSLFQDKCPLCRNTLFDENLSLLPQNENKSIKLKCNDHHKLNFFCTKNQTKNLISPEGLVVSQVNDLALPAFLDMQKFIHANECILCLEAIHKEEYPLTFVSIDSHTRLWAYGHHIVLIRCEKAPPSLPLAFPKGIAASTMVSSTFFERSSTVVKKATQPHAKIITSCFVMSGIASIALLFRNYQSFSSRDIIFFDRGYNELAILCLAGHTIDSMLHCRSQISLPLLTSSLADSSYANSSYSTGLYSVNGAIFIGGTLSLLVLGKMGRWSTQCRRGRYGEEGNILSGKYVGVAALFLMAQSMYNIGRRLQALHRTHSSLSRN